MVKWNEINSLEGLKHLKEHAEGIYIRIKRDKWKAVSIAEMTALELLDLLIEKVDE